MDKANADLPALLAAMENELADLRKHIIGATLGGQALRAAICSGPPLARTAVKSPQRSHRERTDSRGRPSAR